MSVFIATARLQVAISHAGMCWLFLFVVCTVKVRYSVIENSESCININFENVPVAKLHDIRPR